MKKEIEILGTKFVYDDNNVKIVNSFKETKESEMILKLNLFKITTGYESRRTIPSWIREWKTHNRLYKLGLFRTHTQDCDLEENEKIYRLLIYRILGN